MFAKLLASLGADAPEVEADESDSIAFAAAMLLFEVAWADHDISEEEVRRIDASLCALFGLPEGVATRLAERARIEHVDATSVYPFVQKVRDALNAEQRYRLMVALWQIALVDEAIRDYEESAIRRIAELLYVSHRDFIRAKLEAKKARR